MAAGRCFGADLVNGLCGDEMSLQPSSPQLLSPCYVGGGPGRSGGRPWGPEVSGTGQWGGEARQWLRLDLRVVDGVLRMPVWPVPMVGGETGSENSSGDLLQDSGRLAVSRNPKGLHTEPFLRWWPSDPGRRVPSASCVPYGRATAPRPVGQARPPDAPPGPPGLQCPAPALAGPVEDQLWGWECRSVTQRQNWSPTSGLSL